MGEPSPQKPPEPAEEPMQFDVSITINKARGLPLPPLFYSNPIVECLWGEPDPALLGRSGRVRLGLGFALLGRSGRVRLGLG